MNRTDAMNREARLRIKLAIWNTGRRALSILLIPLDWTHRVFVRFAGWIDRAERRYERLGWQIEHDLQDVREHIFGAGEEL